MKMDRGKKLESKFFRWMKDSNIYCQKFYDARSIGTPNASARPSDYWVWIPYKLIFVECKEEKGKSLPFTNFRPSQLKEAILSIENKIEYIALIELNNVLFCLKMPLIIDYMRMEERKSISLEWLNENALKIKNREELVSYLCGL